jgi:BlaI family penicillinase repressor
MTSLSRRERQILDILYERGRATAAEVQAGLPDPPSYSTIRALLRVLEEKGHVQHQSAGQRYVFSPKVPRERARRTALKRLLQTFFNDSVGEAVATLLNVSEAKLTRQELDRIEALIEQARKEEKP